MRKIISFLPRSATILIFLMCACPCFAQPSEQSKKMAAEYHQKGQQAQRDGDTDTAIMCYQKAIEMDPTLAVAFNDLGVLYEAKDWNDKAKQAYGKAINLDPILPSPYYNLGSVYEKEGNLEKAVYYFKRRVMLGEWNDEWTAKARRELQGLGVNDPEVRADYLDQYLARIEASGDIDAKPKGNDLDPKKRKRSALLHLARGKQLYYMGMYGEALTELSFAVVLDPKNKEIEKTLEEVQRQAIVSN